MFSLFRLRGAGLGFGVLGFGSRVQGQTFKFSGFQFEIYGLGFGFRVSGLVFRI